MTSINQLSATIDYAGLPATIDPSLGSARIEDRAPISKGSSVRGRHGSQYLVLEPFGGSGAQADVFLARKDNESFVLKVYHAGFSPCEKAMVVLERNECPHIASLIEWGMYSGSYYYEVFPHYPLGTLADWIAQGKCSHTFITRTLLPSLDDALHYLHEHGLVHGDVKPANIFITEGGSSVVLGDFGVAGVLPEGKQTIAFRGTLEYAPPVKHEGNQVAIGAAYDYGALGLVLFESYTGHSPFTGKSLAERDEAWLTFDVSLFPQIPLDASSLIAGLLNRHEGARFGHEQCLAFLGMRDIEKKRGFYGRNRGYRASGHASTPSLELGYVGGKMAIAHDLNDVLRFCELNWDAAIPILSGNSTGKLGRFLRQTTGSDEFYEFWVERFASEPDDERLFLLCAAIRERCEGKGSHSFVFRQERYRNIVHLLESVRDERSVDGSLLLCGECIPEYLTLFGYGSDVSNQVRDVIAAGGTAKAKASRMLAFCSEAPELTIGERRIESVRSLLEELMRMSASDVEELSNRPELSSWLYMHNCPYVLSELESFS